MTTLDADSSAAPVTAPGAPGIQPTFAAGDKDVVLRALGSSRVWATIGGGVLNEVFWPTTSRPQLRDLGFLVSGTDFWVEVKRAGEYTVSVPNPAVPLPTVVHHDDHFTLTLEFVCDPIRDAVVIRYQLDNPLNDPQLALHLLAAPHLGGTGHGNNGWLEGGFLHANNDDDEHLAIVADVAFTNASVGYVGVSDGWQDAAAHGKPVWNYQSAANGNIALTATLAAPQGQIALAFATTATGARTLAHGAVDSDFNDNCAMFRTAWEQWAADLPIFDVPARFADLARTSAMVLKVHEDVTFPGAIVASLATPWGAAHDDPGGYHLVWPRDCAESGLALAAIGLHHDAVRTVHFLAATQLYDGHWPQNFTPGGEPFWTGLQLDEAALPIILAAKLAELGHVDPTVGPVREMVQKAAGYIARVGPFTAQDRWEESSGASPFTLAAVVAALASASLGGFLDDADATYALSLADWWNANIENMVFVADAEIDQQHGTAGHYVRIAQPGKHGTRGTMVLANRQGETTTIESLVGLEFLALVRYGLRAASDPRIVDTVRIIDAELRNDTPNGPLYYRYQHDGYGEHVDGSAFDGHGVGRLWPLLAGERAHYALALGEDITDYLDAIAASTSRGNLLPEQVWDGEPIPEKRLAPWKPSGSATPLVWAHAEYLKLLVARGGGGVADQIASVAARYVAANPIEVAHIRGETSLVTAAAVLVFESDHAFRLHYGTNGWNNLTDVASSPSGLGRHEVRVSR